MSTRNKKPDYLKDKVFDLLNDTDKEAINCQQVADAYSGLLDK